MSDTHETPLETFAPTDLVAAIMLIDTACNAGAFKGWENIQKAFAVRNRLLMFAQQWNNTLFPDSPLETPSSEATTS